MILLVGVAAGQDYRFPTSAEDYAEFYPTAYKDHGGVDWACGSIRYDGHQGSDFGGGSWSGMAEGRDIVAAAVGVVTETHDGEFDECAGDCPDGGYGNLVRIRHPDGKETLYAHLVNGSVRVAPGDHVECGEMIGEMGSSGNSTGPHLHFGVKGLSGSYEDPFDGDCSGAPSYWTDQGEYDGLPGLECDTPPTCDAVEVLSCGDARSMRSDGEGSTDVHGFYGCTEWIYTGPEVVFAVATDRDEPVTVALTGLSADLDLYVLGSDACQAGDCLGASDESKTSDESVTFEAAAGTYYTVVVDGYEGAVSDFALSVGCQGALPVVPSDTGADTAAPADTGAPPDAARGTVASATGCGCQGGGAGGGVAVLLAAASLWRRRRNARA